MTFGKYKGIVESKGSWGDYVVAGERVDGKIVECVGTTG